MRATGESARASPEEIEHCACHRWAAPRARLLRQELARTQRPGFARVGSRHTLGANPRAAARNPVAIVRALRQGLGEVAKARVQSIRERTSTCNGENRSE